MQERIGNIELDYTYYPGEDIYSDGPIEDELLEIAKSCTESELNAEIARRKSWPVLYHFSHIRQNILEWVPFGKQTEFWRLARVAAPSRVLSHRKPDPLPV